MQSWEQMREAYLEWLRVRNYSLKTVKNNERKLKIFTVWALDRGLNSPSEITKAILERYQRYLYNYRKTGSKHGVKAGDDNKPLSVHTQMGYLSALRSFFKWAARQNLLLYNPASEIDLPRPEKRLPKHILNEKEVEQILEQIDITTPLGLRDRAIIETLYSTGMRRLELLNLKIIDIDYERGTVHIRQGKGKKDRTVPIGERACLWVQKYINESRPKLEKNYKYNEQEDYVFLGIDGQKIAPYRLSEIVRNLHRQSRHRQIRELSFISSHLRNSHARTRSRYHLYSTTSRTRKTFHHPNLHPSLHQKTQKYPHPLPPS